MVVVDLTVRLEVSVQGVELLVEAIIRPPFSKGFLAHIDACFRGSIGSVDRVGTDPTYSTCEDGLNQLFG